MVDRSAHGRLSWRLSVLLAAAGCSDPVDAFGRISDSGTEDVQTLPMQLAVGAGHVCLLFEGRIGCWGDNSSGQLGRGIETDEAFPDPALVEGNEVWIDLAVGRKHTCGLDDRGIAKCWGSNEAGQLGFSGIESVTAPAVVATQARFSRIVAGDFHTCGLTGQGELWCWGANGDGQLGLDRFDDFVSSPSEVEAPVGMDVAWDAVSLGLYHSCGRTTEGELACWGSSEFGQLGLGEELDAESIPIVLQLSGVQGVAAGEVHTCALVEDSSQEADTLLCWGQATDNKLGFGSSVPVVFPTEVSLAGLPEEVSASSDGTCVVMDSGVWCTGLNIEGRFGEPASEVPLFEEFLRLNGSADVAHLVLGSHNLCVVTVDSEVLCAGSNEDGALGTGGFDSQEGFQFVNLDAWSDAE